MKRSLLLLTLGAFLACPAFAQSDSTNVPPANPPPGGPPHHDRLGMLTPAEKQELKAAHDAAIKADPTLASDEKDLHDKMKEAHDSGQMPDPDLMDQMMALRQKVHDAMVKVDPNVAPILAKVEAAYMHHKDGSGAPTPTPSSSGSTNSAPSGT